jgi:hypothetical protein
MNLGTMIVVGVIGIIFKQEQVRLTLGMELVLVLAVTTGTIAALVYVLGAMAAQAG